MMGEEPLPIRRLEPCHQIGDRLLRSPFCYAGDISVSRLSLARYLLKMI